MLEQAGLVTINDCLAAGKGGRAERKEDAALDVRELFQVRGRVGSECWHAVGLCGHGSGPCHSIYEQMKDGSKQMIDGSPQTGSHTPYVHGICDCPSQTNKARFLLQ